MEVRFVAPRCTLLVFLVNLFVGPCQEKIFCFEHLVSKHCQIAMANLWNLVVEMAGPHMEA